MKSILVGIGTTLFCAVFGSLILASVLVAVAVGGEKVLVPALHWTYRVVIQGNFLQWFAGIIAVVWLFSLRWARQIGDDVRFGSN